MRIGFVVLHYGDRKVTDACVRSILQLIRESRKGGNGPDGGREEGRERSAPSAAIVLVDNEVRETAGHREALKRHYRNVPEMTVLANRGEGGFSEANNLGYAYAREQLGCGCILVLNNDITFPQRDFLIKLDIMLKEMETVPDRFCHILAPDIIQPVTGEHQNPLDHRLRTVKEARRTVALNRRALKLFDLAYPLLMLWEERTRRMAQKARRDSAGRFAVRQRNIVPCGACLIFTPAFTEREEKAFEPKTRFFYEEYLLALRCRNRGYAIVYDPSLQVLHESGTATKGAAGSRKRKMRFMMENTADACEIYLRELAGDSVPGTD